MDEILSAFFLSSICCVDISDVTSSPDALDFFPPPIIPSLERLGTSVVLAGASSRSTSSEVLGALTISCSGLFLLLPITPNFDFGLLSRAMGGSDLVA